MIGIRIVREANGLKKRCMSRFIKMWNVYSATPFFL